MLTPFYQQWPRAGVLHPQHSHTPVTPALKPPPPPQAASRDQDGFEAPLGLWSVGSFSINQPPNLMP